MKWAFRLCAIVVLGFLSFGCSRSDDVAGPSTPPLSQLGLFPTERVALVGEAITLKVTARDLDSADVSGVVPTYSSSNPAVVLIEPGGRIAAKAPGTATVHASAGGQTAETIIHVGAATYDVAALGPPRVLDANYIDLSKIERISRFRSAIGHSYVDGSGETCRSMKHYFQPQQSVDWTEVEVYAPATGTIWLIAPDGAAGYRLMLRPRNLAALEVTIFHVNVDSGIVKDTWVEAGDRIGRHASPFTMSDIATGVGGKSGTLLSYFETMTDAVFEEYRARGVPSREAAMITKAERDGDPVPCVAEQQFTFEGTLPNWVDLH